MKPTVNFLVLLTCFAIQFPRPRRDEMFIEPFWLRSNPRLIIVNYSILRSLVILVLLQTGGSVFAQTDSTAKQAALDQRVRAELAQFKGKVKLFARNIDTGAVYESGGDDRVQTASTIKIAIMVEAFARVAEGKAKWTDELVLTKEKKVGGSGILQEFADGLRLTFRDGVSMMMIMSDNTATNLVIDVLTADAVNARMESLGLKETRLMRRVFGGGESVEGKKEENKRFGLGRTTPHEMVTLLEKLERGEVISSAASKEMLDLMKREQGTNGIWREQWRLAKATKSGALDALRSNIGILYHPRGRIAVAITCYETPEVMWTVDNPALLLMSRLSEILVDGLGK
jgi:beta-lactamase class A